MDSIPGQSDAGSPAADVGGAPAQPRRVLVIEGASADEPSLAAEVAALRYQVVGPAATARAAIDLAQRERPDLVLLDLRLAGREAPPRAGWPSIIEAMGLPAVIVSPPGHERHVAPWTRLGVLGFLVRPVSRDALRAALAMAWAQHLEQQRLRGQVQALTQKLEDRKHIERAKGLLMQHAGLSEPEAMRRLQKQARDGRRSIASVAQAVIQNYARPRD